jgi:hypothetical protein
VLALLCLSGCSDKPRYRPPGPPEPSPRVGAATGAQPEFQPQPKSPVQASVTAPPAVTAPAPPAATPQGPRLQLEERFGVAAITDPGGRPPLDFAKTQDINALLHQLVELRQRSKAKIDELGTLRSPTQLRKAADCLSGALIEIHGRAHDAIRNRVTDVDQDIKTKRRAIVRLEKMLQDQRDLELDELIINAEQAIGDLRILRSRIEQIEKVQRLVKDHLERLPQRLDRLFEDPIEDTPTMAGVVARTIQSCLRER